MNENTERNHISVRAYPARVLACLNDNRITVILCSGDGLADMVELHHGNSLKTMNDNSRIDAVFACATDFEIVSATHSVIENYYGFESILQRNPHVPFDRWVVHTISANTGLFEGDGYSYFWGSSVDHKGFAESLKVIGLPILSRIIEEAITQVPSSMLGDWDAVDDFFGGEEERIVAADTMDAKLIIENPGITDKASKYVRSHRYSYLDLLEAIDLNITKWRSMIEEYER